MPVIIKDFFMFTASDDQQVMNLQIFRLSKVLANVNYDLNQPTIFPTAHSHKKNLKKNRKNPVC